MADCVAKLRGGYVGRSFQVRSGSNQVRGKMRGRLRGDCVAKLLGGYVGKAVSGAQQKQNTKWQSAWRMRGEVRGDHNLSSDAHVKLQLMKQMRNCQIILVQVTTN